MNYTPKTIRNILKISQTALEMNAIAPTAAYTENLEELMQLFKQKMPIIVDILSEFSEEFDFAIGDIHKYFNDLNHDRTRSLVESHGFIITAVEKFGVLNRLMARLMELLYNEASGERIGMVARSLLSAIHDFNFLACSEDGMTTRFGSKTVVSEILPF